MGALLSMSLAASSAGSVLLPLPRAHAPEQVNTERLIL